MNFAVCIILILYDWGIDDQIGYYIINNKAANSIAIDYILGVIELAYKKAN